MRASWQEERCSDGDLTLHNVQVYHCARIALGEGKVEGATCAERRVLPDATEKEGLSWGQEKYDSRW